MNPVESHSPLGFCRDPPKHPHLFLRQAARPAVALVVVPLPHVFSQPQRLIVYRAHCLPDSLEYLLQEHSILPMPDSLQYGPDPVVIFLRLHRPEFLLADALGELLSSFTAFAGRICPLDKDPIKVFLLVCHMAEFSESLFVLLHKPRRSGKYEKKMPKGRMSKT